MIQREDPLQLSINHVKLLQKNNVYEYTYVAENIVLSDIEERDQKTY